MTNKEVAETILSQIGGRRFITMTGAKNFVAIQQGLQLDLPKTPHYVRDGISRLHIVLTPMDEYKITAYKITAYKIRGMNVKEISVTDGVHAPELAEVFTSLTGLDTHL